MEWYEITILVLLSMWEGAMITVLILDMLARRHDKRVQDMIDEMLRDAQEYKIEQIIKDNHGRL